MRIAWSLDLPSFLDRCKWGQLPITLRPALSGHVFHICGRIEKGQRTVGNSNQPDWQSVIREYESIWGNVSIEFSSSAFP
ncbi:unnamed protein product [Caenorhabditis auriculariae]|uniref:Uncharacterized protein n=1 Tax=Caenorhabditis auriculariae TaxID=2777116 RepID=A0A8S1GRR1_9PELO|nr:unnamed protein product [Caenorhabditis auriculariae]